MAPINFEEHIKEKLEKKRIEPSNNAWARLTDRLDTHEGTSKDKMFWWLGIAASLVGIFLITTLFFKSNKEEAVFPTLVETPVEQSIEVNENPDNEIENSTTNTALSSEIDLNQKPSGKNQYVTKRTVVLKKGKITRSTKEKENIAENSPFEPIDLEKPEQIIKDQNITEALAESSQVEDSQITVSDSEIESLLQLAQKKLAINKILVEKKTTVDAGSLLQDVETDLDESFRDKIFNRIVSGYNTVATAVAERND